MRMPIDNSKWTDAFLRRLREGMLSASMAGNADLTPWQQIKEIFGDDSNEDFAATLHNLTVKEIELATGTRTEHSSHGIESNDEDTLKELVNTNIAQKPVVEGTHSSYKSRKINLPTVIPNIQFVDPIVVPQSPIMPTKRLTVRKIVPRLRHYSAKKTFLRPRKLLVEAKDHETEFQMACRKCKEIMKNAWSTIRNAWWSIMKRNRIFTTRQWGGRVCSTGYEVRFTGGQAEGKFRQTEVPGRAKQIGRASCRGRGAGVV